MARYDLVLSRPHSCHCPIISPSRIGKSSFQDLVLSCRAEGKATSSALEDYSQRKRMDLGALIDETLDPGGFDLLQIDQGVTHNNGIWSSRRPSHIWRTHAPAERKCLRRFWKLMEGKMPLSTSSEPKSCGTIFLQSRRVFMGQSVQKSVLSLFEFQCFCHFWN